MRKRYIPLGFLILSAHCLLAVSASGQDFRLHLFRSVAVDVPPRIDGDRRDAAWSKASAVTMRMTPAEGNGESIKATIASVRTEKRIYFLVSWGDDTENNTHKSWMWNATAKSYEEGHDREDVAAIAFAHTGFFTGDMLSTGKAIWDVWQWKAARTNPCGYAMDKTHVYTRQKPDGKAKSFDARDGYELWISRPEDTGNSVEKTQPAPSEFSGKRVPQYVNGCPSGSAADVRAKGLWADGEWTVEFARKLDTGHAADTSFLQGTPIRMAIAVFDHSEHIDHRVSEVWKLEIDF